MDVCGCDFAWSQKLIVFESFGDIYIYIYIASGQVCYGPLAFGRKRDTCLGSFL